MELQKKTQICTDDCSDSAPEDEDGVSLHRAVELDNCSHLLTMPELLSGLLPVGADTGADNGAESSTVALPPAVAGVGAGDLVGGFMEAATESPLGVVHRQGTAVYFIISLRQKSSEMATGFLTISCQVSQLFFLSTPSYTNSTTP
jgi:hypothetical protein